MDQSPTGHGLGNVPILGLTGRKCVGESDHFPQGMGRSMDQFPPNISEHCWEHYDALLFLAPKLDSKRSKKVPSTGPGMDQKSDPDTYPEPNTKWMRNQSQK